MAIVYFSKQNGELVGQDGLLVGRLFAGNPLDEQNARGESPDGSGDGLLIVRSGRLELPHRTWGPAGASAFEEWCGQLRAMPVFDRGGGLPRVLVRPHHMDVLSDIQRCLSFARAETGGLGLAFDPVGLLAPSMFEKAEDHLRRFADAIRECPAIGAIMLSSGVVSDDAALEATPAHRSEIEVEFLRDFATMAAANGIPLVLRGEPEEQRRDLILGWVG